MYKALIGVLRWAVEIGRIDITTETSMLAGHMVMLREGHFYAVLLVFGYLKAHHHSHIIFDSSYPEINREPFKEDTDRTPFYGEMTEAVSQQAPQPRGKVVVLQMFVNSDHAGDKVTRRSQSVYIQFVGMSLIAWYSKKQGSVETSTFGSEFVALKTGFEANRALLY